MAIFVDKRQVIIFLHLFRASLYGTTGCDNKISTGVLEDGTSIKKNRKNVIIPPSLPPPLRAHTYVLKCYGGLHISPTVLC